MAASDIQTNSLKPKAVTSDGVSITQHPIPDQIEVDRYVSEIAAKTSKKLGFRLAQFRNQGTA